MALFNAAWAVLLLPLLGLGLSYLAETRRGIALGAAVGSALTLLAAVVVLATSASHPGVTHGANLAFWSYSVTQTPFNAAAETVLSSTFQVGVGYTVDPLSAVLACLVAVLALLNLAHLLVQLHRDQRIGSLARTTCLLEFSVLAVVLAPTLFQLLIGVELAGLLAALLVAAAQGPAAGPAARRGYLVWRAGAASLILATVFVYVKFSGAIANAATGSKRTVPAGSTGLDFVALNHMWLAATHGLVTGVGGRTLTLAAVLVVVCAVAVCGVFPFHGLWRSLGVAPGAAGGLVLSLGGMVVGASLLFSTFDLLRVAAGVLPALVVLAAVGSVVAAALAALEDRLRRVSLWVAGSLAATVLMGVGLGTPGAAVPLLIAGTLSVSALAAVTTTMSRDLRVESLGQLGAAWRQTRPTVLLLLLALLACSGLLGFGVFFGRAEVLAVAIAHPAAVARPAGVFRVVAAVCELLSALLIASVAGRAAVCALRGGEPRDPREARQVRRNLANAKRLSQIWPAVTLTGLALLSGLIALPGVPGELGGFLAMAKHATVLPANGLALALSVVVPLAAVLAVAAVRLGQRPWAGEPAWLAWADGGRLTLGLEQMVFGWPARLAVGWYERVANPAEQAARAALGQLTARGSDLWRRPWSWEGRSSSAPLAAVALVAAVVVWVAATHAGAGAP